MSFKPMRATLAALLIAVSMLSLFPVTYASAGRAASQQSASAPRPRRGKNGEPAKSGTPAAKDANQTTANQSATKPATANPGRQSGEKNPQTGSAGAQSSGAGIPAQEPPGSQAGSSQSSQSWPAAQEGVAGQGRQTPDPPPFDRPPLGSQPKPQAGSQPNRAEQTARDQGAPPVLRRQPEYDPPASSSRRDRPVLRRPSDPPAQSGREPAPSSNEPVANDRRPAGGDAPAAEGDEVIKLESTLVNIPLLVSDRSGRYIPQLSKDDFLLYEDGMQQEIASFGSEEVPFNVVLMLDVSPSVQGSLQEIHDAALQFVRQLRPDDRVMVVSFDREVHYHTDFTNNRRELEWAIRSTATGMGTSVYDAVYETVERRLRHLDGRKALILFSDGEDTSSSHASYDDAVNIVTEADVLVYGLRYPSNGGGSVQVDPWPRTRIPQIPFPIPFPWPGGGGRRRRWPFFTSPMMPQVSGNSAVASAVPDPSAKRGRGDFMKDITEAGGGPVYDADRISDLSRLASRIAEELRHVYVISYYPTNPLSNGGYRSIRVRVRSRDDIAVRHRKGYNAREASRTRT